MVRLATKAGHVVRVVQTPDSQRFVGAPSFAALSGAPVLVSEWERDPARGAFPDQPPPDHEPLSHLELVRNADVLLIAPATANTIAKLAHGDRRQPAHERGPRCDLPAVIVAPAMNHHMWEHAATRANMATLRERGVTMIDPEVGALAGRTSGAPAGSPNRPTLLAAVEALVPSGGRPLDGLRVLVTAGGTREPIDAVRFVGNRSSGRMGFALADEAAALGATVTVIAANVALLAASARAVRRRQHRRRAGRRLRARVRRRATCC